LEDKSSPFSDRKPSNPKYLEEQDRERDRDREQTQQQQQQPTVRVIRSVAVRTLESKKTLENDACINIVIFIAVIFIL